MADTAIWRQKVSADEVTIARARMDELDALADIWELSAGTNAFLTADDVAAAKKLIRDDYLARVAELYAVKDNRGDMVGFFGIEEGKMEMLFLRPESQSKGMGTYLMERAITGHHVDSVDVNEENPRALAFYRRLGFEVIGRSDSEFVGHIFHILHMKLVRNKDE